MLNRVTLWLVLLALAAVPAGGHDDVRDPAELTVHEWGTFTSVAGEDGQPVEWMPLDGAQDLPCFVDRLTAFPKGLGVATVRMETPVLCFYTPRSTSVDVRVTFRQGTITELFPRAELTPRDGRAALFRQPGFTSTATWRDVKVSPGRDPAFPREAAANHYYAARATDAASIRVGAEQEKFLFYRGIGQFALPLSATVAADGTVTVTAAGSDAIPALVLFENRAGRVGYRVLSGVASDVSIAAPPLSASLADLTAELERTLVRQGLYAREASAMIETWRDSWFAEGSRLFYIVPPRAIDAVLPLDIKPKPADVARVFVARMELNAPRTKRDIAAALAAGDIATLARYGRFARPFSADRLTPRTPAPERQRLERLFLAASRLLQRGPACPAD